MKEKFLHLYSVMVSKGVWVSDFIASQNKCPEKIEITQFWVKAKLWASKEEAERIASKCGGVLLENFLTSSSLMMKEDSKSWLEREGYVAELFSHKFVAKTIPLY